MSFQVHLSQLQVNCDVNISIAQSIVTPSPERKQTNWGMMAMC